MFTTYRNVAERHAFQTRFRLGVEYSSHIAVRCKDTGLGLAFYHLVVEAHGGEITAQDAPGSGSDSVTWIPRQ